MAPTRSRKPKSPDAGCAELVAHTAVEAAQELAAAWPAFTYRRIRAVTIDSIYLAFAGAIGMRVPSLELVLEPWRAGLDAFVTRVRSLPFAELTPENFGAAHETLTGHGLERGRVVRTNGRRAGGVHFTPRSLTEPIVRKGLGPLLPLVAPERTLDLRICDPSCGAGAFLLELVRQLGARTFQAGLASSLEEAKRLVAIHCAYGTDICDFAVHSAKLALTLECRADRMPATWLDDNIKRGDALVGLMRDQLARFHWSPSGKTRKGEAIPEVPELARCVDRAVNEGAAARTARMGALAALARKDP